MQKLLDRLHSASTMTSATAVMAPGMRSRSATPSTAAMAPRPSTKPFGPVNQGHSRARTDHGRGSGPALASTQQNQAGPQEINSSSKRSAAAVKVEMDEDATEKAAAPAKRRVPKSDDPNENSPVSPLEIRHFVSQGEAFSPEIEAFPRPRNGETLELLYPSMGERNSEVEAAAAVSHQSLQNALVSVDDDGPPSQGTIHYPADHQLGNNGLLHNLLLMPPHELETAAAAADSQLKTEISFPGILKHQGAPSSKVQPSTNLQEQTGKQSHTFEFDSDSPTLSFEFEGRKQHRNRANSCCHDGEAHDQGEARHDGGLDTTAERIFHFLHGVEDAAASTSAAAAEADEDMSTVTTTTTQCHDHEEGTYDFLSTKRNSLLQFSPLSRNPSDHDLSRYSEIFIPLQKSAAAHDQQLLELVNAEKYHGHVERRIHEEFEAAENQCSSLNEREGHEHGRQNSADCQHQGQAPAADLLHHDPQEYQLELAEPLGQQFLEARSSPSEIPTRNGVHHPAAATGNQSTDLATHFHNLLSLGVNENDHGGTAPGAPPWPAVPPTGFIHGTAQLLQQTSPDSVDTDELQLQQQKSGHGYSGHVYPFFSQVPGTEEFQVLGSKPTMIMTPGLNTALEIFAHASNSNSTTAAADLEAADWRVSSSSTDSQFLSLQPFPHHYRHHDISNSSILPQGSTELLLNHHGMQQTGLDDSISYDVPRHPQRPFRHRGKLHAIRSSRRFLPFSGKNFPLQGARHQNGSVMISCSSGLWSSRSIPPQPPPPPPLLSLEDRHHLLKLCLKAEPIPLPGPAVDLHNPAAAPSIISLRPPKAEPDDVDTQEKENRSNLLLIHPQLQLEFQGEHNFITGSKSSSKWVSSSPTQKRVQGRRDAHGAHQNISKGRTSKRKSSSKSVVAYGFKNVGCSSLYPPNVTVEKLKRFKLHDFPMWTDFQNEMGELEALFCEGISFSKRRKRHHDHEFEAAADAKHVVNEGISLSNSFACNSFRHVKGEADIVSCLLPPTGSRITEDSLKGRKSIYQARLNEIDDWYWDFCSTLQHMNRIFDTSVKYPISKCYSRYPVSGISRRLRRYRDCFVQHLLSVKGALAEEAKVSGFKSRVRAHRAAVHRAEQERIVSNMRMVNLHSVAWRPQRGLPERAVVVLKAWLFGHFLHPYPKDGDKAQLAKTTGLTRGQVSNWFINARVRVWKPMIEDMYRYEYPSAPLTGGNQATKAAVVTSAVITKREIVPQASGVKPEGVAAPQVNNKKRSMPKAPPPNQNGYGGRSSSSTKRQCPNPSLSGHEQQQIQQQNSNALSREEEEAVVVVPPELALADARTMIPIPPRPSFARAHGAATIVPPPTNFPNILPPHQPRDSTAGHGQAEVEGDHEIDRSRAPPPTTLLPGVSHRHAFAPLSREALARFLAASALKKILTKVRDPTRIDPRTIADIFRESHGVSQLGFVPKNSNGAAVGVSSSSAMGPRFLPSSSGGALSTNHQLRMADGDFSEGGNEQHRMPIPKLLSPDELAMVMEGKHYSQNGTLL